MATDAGSMSSDTDASSTGMSEEDAAQSQTSGLHDGGHVSPSTAYDAAHPSSTHDATSSSTMPTDPIEAGSGNDASTHELDAALARDAASRDDASRADAGTTTHDAGEDCVPTGDERCFNGADDDCDHRIDCADPECAIAATCEPTGETQGVLIEASEDCPEGYQEEVVELHQGLDAPECSGCTCTPTTTECSGELYFYEDSVACAADMSPYSGGVLVDAVTAECPASPHMEGFTSGYRVGAISPVAGTGTCSPDGSPTLGTPSWLTSMKYCIAEAVGDGCEVGYACVPQATSGTACTESDSACVGDQIESTWYEDYDDSRICGACTCDGSGDCSNVGVRLGSDWSCEVDSPSTPAGEKRCDITPYSPPAVLGGTPTEPVCQPSAETTGALAPIGTHTLCCDAIPPT